MGKRVQQRHDCKSKSDKTVIVPPVGQAGCHDLASRDYDTPVRLHVVVRDGQASECVE
ncbi:hypothetical protein KP626_04245 [Christensenella sp. MSJ-20]|uniref:hypothetical protein n=1 Tax=Christensenella sp. MSJ-20 TaxID=2841518 RepID=UPI001C76F247|nr:hypothetical protein KP626_04245 [Christensenella sp. MSJ-20]